MKLKLPHSKLTDYDLVIDRLHLNYDFQLVTFGIDKVRWPVFVYCVMDTIQKSFAYMTWKRSYCVSSNMT